MTGYEKRKKIKTALAAALMTANMVSVVPVYASEPDVLSAQKIERAEQVDNHGWHEEGGRWYYVENGKRVLRSWKKIEGCWYYFDSEGYRYEDGSYQLKIGIDGEEDTNWYCFDPNGRMVTGWYRPLSFSDRYYYQEDGRAAKGMQQVDGAAYYFGSRGEMQRDFIFRNVEGTCEYYFGADGKLAAEIDLKRDGWKNASDRSRYYVKSGRVLRNCWKHVDKHWYYFDDDGKMLKNTEIVLYTEDKGWSRYRLAYDGVMVTGWYQDEDLNWFGYDRSGAMYSGLQTIGEELYYFDLDGMLLVNGAVYVDGVLYTAGPNGDCSVCSQNGWVEDMYYVDQGRAATGWKKVADRMYYFDPKTGKKTSDTVRTIDGNCYSFDREGVLETGWIKGLDDGWFYWMYADPDGVLAADEWIETDAGRCYFDDSCRMATGVVTIEGRHELFGKDGIWKETLETQGWQEDDRGNRYYIENNVILKDTTQIIDGKTYHFDEYGKMVCNSFFDNYYFGEQGAAVTGQWKTDETGDRHYYASDGQRYEDGWKNIQSSWYFFKDGSAVTEDCLIDGKRYHFEEDGASNREEVLMADGWNKMAGQVYYRRDGLFLTGIQKIENDSYYFYEDGNLARQARIVDSVSMDSYFVDESGKMVFGAWCMDEDVYYYAGADGRLVTGLQTINGKRYYFDEEGVMYDEDVIREDTGELYVIQHSGSIKEIVKPAEPGWIWKNGHWFFVRNKKFRKGYIETGGNSFYFYGNGQMAVDTVVEGYGYADPDGYLHMD